jgi:hypothetical protein
VAKVINLRRALTMERRKNRRLRGLLDEMRQLQEETRQLVDVHTNDIQLNLRRIAQIQVELDTLKGRNNRS